MKAEIFLPDFVAAIFPALRTVLSAQQSSDNTREREEERGNWKERGATQQHGAPLREKAAVSTVSQRKDGTGNGAKE